MCVWVCRPFQTSRVRIGVVYCYVQKGLMWDLFTCNEICIVRRPVAVSDTIVSPTDCEMCALSELAVFSMKRNAEISRIDRR